MNVPSLQFLGFALVGALIFNLSSNTRWRALTLCVLNIAFFSTFLRGWISAVPYAAFLLLGFIAIRVLHVRRSTTLGALFVAATLAAFFVLKRYSFVPEPLLLPYWYTAIGLSYVFFRVLHLVIDVSQDAIEERIAPLSYFNYVLNFPALVSGPIQRYEHYHESEQPGAFPLDWFVIGHSFERIVRGFFKVTVVSSLLLMWQKSCISQLAGSAPLPLRAADLALICGLYPLYLYANFSGYTDFVIGAARLFRIELPENFNEPFTSENFITFWSRWHMTLSDWLKTYVYSPLLLTLMRRITVTWIEPYLAVFAYFVTFFLVGAWHGQTSMFLFFGILQGGGVALNKLYQVAMTARLGRQGYQALCANPAYRAAARGLTYTWFAFTLFWFWSSWEQLGVLAATAGPAGMAVALLFLFAVATVLLSALALAKASGMQGSRIFEHRYVRTVVVTSLAVVTLAALVLLGGTPPDLVYKNF
jgi:alginate O-acetyltransferase complex protein AlgI